ncbi:Fungal lipase-like domain [Dillenia turbinata]|uniref:Fungal lipase-like domain n=1 Tax=Dillenia turbinata TaxID=194707 RepID=A0AAN8YV42_9MAGN
MASLPRQLHIPHPFPSIPPKLHLLPIPYASLSPRACRIRVLSSNSSKRRYFSSCVCKNNGSNVEVVLDKEERIERPPFDINLAVILAGFSFEAYTTPPENIGKREVDAANCKAAFLSESFIREIYDGQLFIKLKKGLHFPAMDPWGTSDPYVVMQLDGQVVKSKTKWGTKDPTWNEEFSLNIKRSPTKILQVAAWDANLVTPHKRMGNASINLDSLCDGNTHDMPVELEGMGGGGQIQLEIKYKTFDEIIEEKKWWRIPFVSELLRSSGFASALKIAVGSETVPARQFVQYAFGQLKLLNGTDTQKDYLANKHKNALQDDTSKLASVPETPRQLESSPEGSLDVTRSKEDSNLEKLGIGNNGSSEGNTMSLLTQFGETKLTDKQFWKNFTEVVNKNVVQKLGLAVPENIKWDAVELLKRFGKQSRKVAEAGYIESGLATPEDQDANDATKGGSFTADMIEFSIPDIKKASEELLRQTEGVLGALMVLTATGASSSKESVVMEDGKTKGLDLTKLKRNEEGFSDDSKIATMLDGPVLDENEAEEMKKLFSTAESAMEAWAMLATSLGHPSFIKSEFEKICFLDNPTTDTQVAIWRDALRKRLVVAFRGTEQSRWKDLRTDLMLAPAGLNPERLGGDFKQEIQVHSGFLSAYDSVRTRILSIIKLSIQYIDDGDEPLQKWHVYVTGHSLGGALATLLALELSLSQLAKRGAINVTMYNFGSPRVGNRRFAEVYNEKVKDSWRVVNHRDIIPSVPRLMGYCHVEEPVYLAPGSLRDAMGNMEFMVDGYKSDVIGEATPDVLVSEFMKGEKELIEKILQTEINIFSSLRDGSGLVQHMEDFYYITLLENVRLNYRTQARTTSGKVSLSIAEEGYSA